jgi:hypothetical protein
MSTIETLQSILVIQLIVVVLRMKCCVEKMVLLVRSRGKITFFFIKTYGTDLTDLLKDEIKGPASFNCNGKDCAFSEPAMDDLISAVFGDDSIFLSCNSGECLHYTMVPGFEVRKLAR